MDLSKPNYRAWLIDEADFPHGSSMKDKIKALITYGVLAPSTHNTQPWLFAIKGSQLSIKPDQTRSLSVGDPNKWGMYISLGACTENIIQAAQVFGLSTSIKWTSEEITISFADSKRRSTDSTIINAIKKRQSDKLPYLAKSIPTKVNTKLEAMSNQDITIRVVSDKPLQDAIIENHIKAAKSIAQNPLFVHELSNWLRSNNTSAFDGMPGFVIGNSNAKSVIGKALLKKKPVLLQKMVTKDKQLLESAPAFIVFLVEGSVTPAKAVGCGRLVEKTWLELTKQGLSAHPLFAAIEDPTARKELMGLFKTRATPLFFLRIGYGKGKQLHTPRATMNSTAMPSLTKLSNSLSSQPKSEHVSIGNYRINYVTAGQGKPLILIHGANIGWPQWYLNIDHLARHFKVYALDLPGAGDSTKVNFRKMDFEEDYLDIVDQFIKKLGLKQVDIIGSSFGGWIAMRLAMAQRPYLRKLIVANPIGFTRHMPMKFRPISIWPLATLMSKTALRPERTNKNLEKFMRDVFYEKDLPLSTEFIDYFYELSKESHNVLFISKLAHYSGMRKELFLGSKLEDVKIPTLIIWGKQDPLMPYATVKDNFKYIVGAKIKLLEHVGHMPPVEASKEFNSLVTDFLKNDR